MIIYLGMCARRFSVFAQRQSYSDMSCTMCDEALETSYEAASSLSSKPLAASAWSLVTCLHLFHERID